MKNSCFVFCGNLTNIIFKMIGSRTATIVYLWNNNQHGLLSARCIRYILSSRFSLNTHKHKLKLHVMLCRKRVIYRMVKSQRSLRRWGSCLRSETAGSGTVLNKSKPWRCVLQQESSLGTCFRIFLAKEKQKAISIIYWPKRLRSLYFVIRRTL